MQYLTVVACKRVKVSNLMEHLQCSHSLKVGECRVFDCLHKANKINNLADAVLVSVAPPGPGIVSYPLSVSIPSSHGMNMNC